MPRKLRAGDHTACWERVTPDDQGGLWVPYCVHCPWTGRQAPEQSARRQAVQHVIDNTTADQMPPPIPPTEPADQPALF